MGSVYFFSFIIVSVYFFASIYREPAKPSPYIIYIYSLYFYSSVLGERALYFSEPAEAKWYSYYLTTIFAIFLGEFLSKRMLFFKRLDINPSIRLLKLSVLLCLLIVTPFFIYIFSSLGGYMLSGSITYGEVWKRSRELVLFGNPTLQYGLLIIISYFIWGNKFILLALLPMLIVAFVTGERGILAIVLTSMIPIFFYKKKNKLWYPMVFALMVAIAGVYGNARAQLAYGAVHFAGSIADRIIAKPVLLIAPLDINEFVNVSAPAKAAMNDDFELPDKGMNILRGIFKALPVAGRYIDGAYGQSSQIVNDNYAPGLISDGIVTGTGDLFLLGFDLYLAGGMIAVFLGMLFSSYFINRLFIVYKTKDNIFFKLLYIVSFPMFVLQIQRSSFESAFPILIKQYYMFFFVAMLLYFFAKIIIDAKKIK